MLFFSSSLLKPIAKAAYMAPVTPKPKKKGHLERSRDRVRACVRASEWANDVRCGSSRAHPDPGRVRKDATLGEGDVC